MQQQHSHTLSTANEIWNLAVDDCGWCVCVFFFVVLFYCDKIYLKQQHYFYYNKYKYVGKKSWAIKKAHTAILIFDI